MKTLNLKSVFLSTFLIICLGVYLLFWNSGQELDCVKVTQGEIKDSVTGNVHILAEQTYQLKSSLQGTISMVAKLPLAKSILVEKNQIIAQLDITDLNRTLKQALTTKEHFIKRIETG